MIATDEILLQHVLSTFDRLFPESQVLRVSQPQSGALGDSNNAGFGPVEAGDSEDES